MINTILAVNQEFCLSSADSILALSDISFDLSVFDIFALLSVGGKIIYPQETACYNPKHWLELIKTHNITIWNSVPQLMQLLIDEMGSCEDLLIINSLRLILLSGDWVAPSLVKELKNYVSKSIALVALGGATEASIWSIWYQITDSTDLSIPIPYGIAMPNQQIFVLDESGNDHSPIGVIGHIFIGGVGLAVGYWRDEIKTNLSFIQHPVLGQLYRTGDLGRVNANGYIEFLGRQDSQTKLNGYRIDLGEIEAILSKLDIVKQAVVVLDNGVLNAYLVLNTQVKTVINDLNKFFIEYLSDFLPNYMVPNAYVIVDSFKLTLNGKLDRASLPKFIPSINNPAQKLLAVTDEEQAMCKLWAEVLNINSTEICLNDKFIELGGNSLLAIKLINKINYQFGHKLLFKDLFEHSSINKLIAKLNATKRGKIVEF